jgi:hypothetical protein
MQSPYGLVDTLLRLQWQKPRSINSPCGTFQLVLHPEPTAELHMFTLRILAFCIFLTSGFAGTVQSAHADYCFENANKSGVMSQKICFSEIKILKPGTSSQKVYIRNVDIDDVFAIQNLKPVDGGYRLHTKGDYINYSERCGLTILSQFDAKLFINEQMQYQHVPSNVINIKFRYTANNCQSQPKGGAEKFTPIF